MSEIDFDHFAAVDMRVGRIIEVEWDGAQPALAWGWQKPEGKALLTQWRTTPFARIA